MKRALILGFLLLLSFDTATQVGIKLLGEHVSAGSRDVAWLLRIVREPLFFFVLACHAGAFATYISLLKHAPVGPAYAAAHGHIVTVLIISVLFLGERLSLLQSVGALAILSGIVTLALTETAARPAESTPQENVVPKV